MFYIIVRFGVEWGRQYMKKTILLLHVNANNLLHNQFYFKKCIKVWFGHILVKNIIIIRDAKGKKSSEVLSSFI